MTHTVYTPMPEELARLLLSWQNILECKDSNTKKIENFLPATRPPTPQWREATITVTQVHHFETLGFMLCVCVCVCVCVKWWRVAARLISRSSCARCGRHITSLLRWRPTTRQSARTPASFTASSRIAHRQCCRCDAGGGQL